MGEEQAVNTAETLLKFGNKGFLQCCSKCGRVRSNSRSANITEWCLGLFWKHLEMAFLQNWRVRRVQQTKWAGWAFLTVSRLNHGPHGKLQGFLLSPPLNQASPAFSLLLTLVPAALWACLWLSSLSIPVPCCTHRRTHTHKAPKALSCWALAGLSHCPGDWPSPPYLQAVLAQTASKSNFKTEVLNSSTLLLLYSTFSHLQVFLTALAHHLPNFLYVGSWPGLMAVVSEHLSVMHEVMWLMSGSGDLFSLPIFSQEGGLCLLCRTLCFVRVKFQFVRFSCDREAGGVTRNLHSFIPSMCPAMLKIFTIFMLSLHYIPLIPRIFGIVISND